MEPILFLGDESNDHLIYSDSCYRHLVAESVGRASILARAK
jgi:hypothetical protein